MNMNMNITKRRVTTRGLLFSADELLGLARHEILYAITTAVKDHIDRDADMSFTITGQFYNEQVSDLDGVYDVVCKWTASIKYADKVVYSVEHKAVTETA